MVRVGVVLEQTGGRPSGAVRVAAVRVGAVPGGGGGGHITRFFSNPVWRSGSQDVQRTQLFVVDEINKGELGEGKKKREILKVLRRRGPGLGGPGLEIHAKLGQT